MASTTIKQLDRLPKVDGQYADGRESYDMPLPVPGAPVQTTKFGVIDIEVMKANVIARKAAFEQNQRDSLYSITTWEHVGYYVDPETQAVTYVYQLKRPWDVKPPEVWTNYPDEPPVYRPSWLV